MRLRKKSLHLGVRIGILALAGSLLLMASIVPAVKAVENYSLTPSPNRVQEGSSSGVSLPLSVTNASTFTTYRFVWTVIDPSGTSSAANANINTFFATSFVLSRVFPRDFGGAASTQYVGNYTVRVDQTAPTARPSIASGRFEVGLTDAKTYQRTSTISIQAAGYQAGENVTISISSTSTAIAGFPTWGSAAPNGVFSYLWQSSPSTPTGVYTLDLQGSSTVKAPPDAQSFTMFPTNITIPSMVVARTSLQRSELQEFRITANYLSGVPVQSGSVTLTLVEATSSSTYFTTAYYDATLALFRTTYSVPLSARIGTWASRIEVNSFSDGYGNGGPSVGVTKGFDVQPAVLAVTVSIANKTYSSGDLVAIYATVLNPSGAPFSSGTVTASLSVSGPGTPIGNKIPLQYVTSQGRWVGSITVNPTDPQGIWLVNVAASDQYGNLGEGTQLAVVSVAPIQSANLFFFFLATAVLGSGAAAGLLLKKFNASEAPFEELYRLTGGEFQPPTSLMIRGESGSGTTTLGLQLISRQLQAGRCGIILTYNSFPAEVQKTMESMGWDAGRHVQDGSLKFLDCYSALAGGEAPIKDPVDFTEVSIQVSSMVDSSKGPVTVLLDSFTPIFNSAQPRHAINFLRILSAKVKNDGGFLILTGAKGSLPDSVESNLEAVVDGLIDLEMVRRGKSLVRLLRVRKISGRQINPAETEFDIRLGKGISFKKPRISVDLFRPRTH